ncbi:hypothetical protein FRC15_010665 [Serendipita sp. 397]|nr:hypothetical protein FRC15_010665 [Serendipita sp. 397]
MSFRLLSSVGRPLEQYSLKSSGNIVVPMRCIHTSRNQFLLSSSSGRWRNAARANAGRGTADGPNGKRFASGATTAEMPAKSNLALRMALGMTLLSVTTYSLGVLYPPNLYTLIYPRVAPPSPDKGSVQALKDAAELERQLWELPLVQDLARRSHPLNSDTVPANFLGPNALSSSTSTSGGSSDEASGGLGLEEELTHYMARPYLNLPESFSRHSLTAGLLQGPGRMAIPPLLFVRTDEKAITGVMHLGRSICGHDGIVHGGAIATLFDDAFFRTAVANFPARIGVTAWLKIDYRAPTRADQFVVFKTKVDKVEGRKVFVSGQMEDVEGNLLVQASALFVQPKYAHLIKSEEREKHFLNRPAAIARTLEPVGENADMQ